MEDALVVIRVSELINLIQESMKEEISKTISESVPPDEILNIEDLTKLLKISRGFEHRLRKLGLPYHVIGIGSGSIRYIRSEVIAWVSSKKKQHDGK